MVKLCFFFFFVGMLQPVRVICANPRLPGKCRVAMTQSPVSDRLELHLTANWNYFLTQSCKHILLWDCFSLRRVHILLFVVLAASKKAKKKKKEEKSIEWSGMAERVQSDFIVQLHRGWWWSLWSPEEREACLKHVPGAPRWYSITVTGSLMLIHNCCSNVSMI